MSDCQPLLEWCAPLSTVATNLKKQLLQELESRMADLEHNDILLKACLLDPRYKGHYVSGQITKERNKGSFPRWPKRYLIWILSLFLCCSAVARKGLYMIIDHHDEQFSDAAVNTMPMKDKRRRFLDADNTPRTHDPIKCWKDNSNRYPGLAKVALKYLIRPATSVSPERMGSALNLAVPSLRGRMNDKKIEMRLTFMTMPEKYWKECAP